MPYASCPFCKELPHPLIDCPASFTRHQAVEKLIQCRSLLDRAHRELSETNERREEDGKIRSAAIDQLLTEIDIHLYAPTGHPTDQ